MEARVQVRLTPRADRNALVGWAGDSLLVRVTAPPLEDKANAALELLLARALGVPKSSVRVVSGARSRNKTVVIGAVSQDEAVLRLRKATGS
jgi:uncharacterized protein (TIGR00251 family)